MDRPANRLIAAVLNEKPVDKYHASQGKYELNEEE